MTLNRSLPPTKKNRKAAAYPRPCTREALTEAQANRRATKANRKQPERILTPGNSAFCTQCQAFHFNLPKRTPKKTLP
jgi:hypothetical protein